MHIAGRTVLAALVASMLARAPALGRQITLRVADHYPAGSPAAAMTAKFFMDEVTKQTNGRVKFEYFPAEQLGKAKHMLALTLSGVTDIGFAAPAYVSDKLPLGAVAELPGTFAEPCEGTMAPYQILTRPNMTGLASLKGSSCAPAAACRVSRSSRSARCRSASRGRRSSNRWRAARSTGWCFRCRRSSSSSCRST